LTLPESEVAEVKTAIGQELLGFGAIVNTKVKMEVPQSSLIVNGTAKVPGIVGVPEIIPNAESRFSPDGREPEVLKVSVPEVA